MRQFDDLEKSLAPLLAALGQEERAEYEARISRLEMGIQRLESDNAFLLRERASIHALLKKTSDDLVHRYQVLFENSGTAMVVIEDDGTISLVNGFFEQISGYSRKEIEHVRSIFSFIDPAEMDRVTGYHKGRRLDNATIPRVYETRFIRRDGRSLNVVISVQVFPGTLQSIASIIDITERRQAEDALRLAHTKLHLLSNLSRHDILNQLTVLGGYLELSRRLTTEPRLLDYISREIHVTRQITELISFTKDYQDIGIQAPVWHNLETTIFRAARNIPMGGVNLEVEVGTAGIYADPLLERVFYNLIENALNYGKSLTRIRFSFVHSGGEGMIICEDDGVGIPAGEKENIFRRKFFQHTGLGMYLSRDILAITGITIRETGVPGKGARFEIVVPEGVWRRGNHHG
jgi:PAS domain S-box-containing protein